MLLEVQVSRGSVYQAGLVWGRSALCISHPPGIRGGAEECSVRDGRGTRGPMETEKAFKSLDLEMAHHDSFLILLTKVSHVVELQVKGSRKVGWIGVCSAFMGSIPKSHAKGLSIRRGKNS